MSEAGRATPRRAVLYTLLTLMVFFWAANFSVSKIGLREWPPMLMIGLRVLIAMVGMVGLYWWKHGQRDESPWSWSDAPRLCGLGLLGVALNQLFFILGITRTTVAHAAIVIATGPIVVLLIAAALGQERITARKAVGMLTAVAGVGLLQRNPAAQAPGVGPSLLGDLFIFLSASSFAAYTVFGKRMNRLYGSYTVNAFAYVAGAAVLLPWGLYESAGFSLAAITWKGWLALLYMALLPSFLCYLIFSWAISHTTATRVAVFYYLQPLFATSLGIALLGERLTWPLVTGGAVIFLGVVMTERG